MKKLYPIVVNFDDESGCYLVYSPDFEVDTFGKTLEEALDMAADAVQLAGVTMQDFNEEVPAPSNWRDVTEANPSALVTLVEADFDRYRLFLEKRSIKKNCTIPAWLEKKASEAGLNFSAVLADGLKVALGISDLQL